MQTAEQLILARIREVLASNEDIYTQRGRISYLVSDEALRINTIEAEIINRKSTVK